MPLRTSFFPLSFKLEAFHTTTFLINVLPTPVLNHKTPLFHLFKLQPECNCLRTFRCNCFPHIQYYNNHKFDFHTKKKSLFLGYNDKHHGYKCLSLLGKLYITRHLSFNELYFPHVFLFKSTALQNHTNTFSSSSL